MKNHAKKVESQSLQLVGTVTPEFSELLTEDALAFAGELEQRFGSEREKLLEHRKVRQEDLANGKNLDFLPETEQIRNSSWTIAPVPADLQDRRVEITGPAGDRKMVINALNSGAKVFMADFEDANSPTWQNTMQGQLNLRDAIRRSIEFSSPEGKRYTLQSQVATLIVRPRGWHLLEKNVLSYEAPISASLFDFGMYFYHNAKHLIENGSGPYYYLPKMESHLEARLWNDVFVYAQQRLGIPQGTIKATVLIETITAAFEMDEILHELREHSAGLNCGRWDYIFSYIKKLRYQPDLILPDRAEVTMTSPFMRAYSLLAIKTCHRRKAHAMGGMAAQIPIKNDPTANEQAMSKVRADKQREARDGHDGTWVAHPGLVPVAMEVFDALMPGPNQIEKTREDVEVSAKDLLEIPVGTITEEGLRTNIRVAVLYIEAWLGGSGAVPIDHLMEDAATAEISRAQVWQWIRHPDGELEDGRKVTEELVRHILNKELLKIREQVGDPRFTAGHYDEAKALFEKLIAEDDFVEFLTLPGYDYLN